MKNKGLKIAYVPYYGQELNNIAFSDKYKYRWTNILKEKLEKDGHTIATYDILPIEESDAILCFDNVYFQNNRHFWKMFISGKLGSTVHIDYEPPSANCRIHSSEGLKKLSNLFKVIVTYNDAVVNNKTIVKGCIADYLTKELEYKNNFKDKKFLLILANYRVDLMLFGQHKDELYSKRGEAVLYFQNKCPEEFDLYGNYWPETHMRCYKGNVEREEKINVISQYKFIISYDSITNQKGYISEKIFDCFKAKTIPVYWGADNVTDYIPKECFIDKRDFKSYDDLYDYLINMTEEEYNQRITAIEKYLRSEKYLNLFSSEASADILYKVLLKKKRHINYIKAFKILLEFQKKRMSDIRYNYDNFYFDTRKVSEVKLYDCKYEEGLLDSFLKFKIRLTKKHKYKFYVCTNSAKKLIEVHEKDLDNVYAKEYGFELSVNEILKEKMIRLFVSIDDKDKKLFKLKIDSLVNWDYLNKELNLVLKKNKIYIKKRTIVQENLKKLKNNKFVIVLCRIAKLPYTFMKQLIDVFRT